MSASVKCKDIKGQLTNSGNRTKMLSAADTNIYHIAVQFILCLHNLFP